MIYFKHLIVDLIRDFAAFTGNMDVPGSPEAYYANVNTSLNIAKTASYVSVTLLTDALLVSSNFIQLLLRPPHKTLT